MFKMLWSMGCLRPLVVMSISMMLLGWEETLSLRWLQIRRKRIAAWVPYLRVSLLGDLFRHDEKIEYPYLCLVKSSEHSFQTSFSFAENLNFIEILRNTNTNMYIISNLKGSTGKKRTLDIVLFIINVIPTFLVTFLFVLGVAPSHWCTILSEPISKFFFRYVDTIIFSAFFNGIVPKVVPKDLRLMTSSKKHET